MDDIKDMIAAQRSELAAVLAGLPAASWDAPTLCDGWRVREVVAHITMPFRYSRRRFAVELVRSRGHFNEMADRCARRDAAAQSAAELTESLRSNADHPWQPPGGGPLGALTHDVIHGLDITEALGLGLRVPLDRLDVVLPNLASPRSAKFFGLELRGVELHATDTGWRYGAGTPVTGTAQELALFLCGRRLQGRGQPLLGQVGVGALLERGPDGVGALLEQHPEAGLVEDGDA